MHPWHGKTWQERKDSAAEFKQWYFSNPDTRLVAGHIGQDGLVFASYHVNSKNGEKWQSASAYNAAIIRMRQWHSKNRDSVLAGRRESYANSPEIRASIRRTNKKWARENRERYDAAVRSWRYKNPERWAEHQAKWRERNIEKIREKGRRYAKEHPEKKNAITARRWAAKKRQLHPDHNREAEWALRAEATCLTKETGIKHHVDHIIPLAHGGWHHHDNLQVVTIAENLQKHADPFYELPGRKTWRDVPKHLWPESLAEEYARRAA